MQLTELKVNHLTAPLGYQTSPLSFSWKVMDAAPGAKQAWAQVKIFRKEEVLFDSGRDETADSLDYAVSLLLTPRTMYRWEVTVMATSGESAVAESTFETGKMDEAWNADWITADLDADTPAVLETHFKGTQCESGRLYIAGLGVYEAWLNGEKVGNEFLAPGYHSYDFHVQVNTYDVGSLLKDGDNELKIYLGDGWYRGRLGFDGGYTNLYGDRCYAIAELYGNNTLLVKTDGSWQAKKSPIVFSNIYDGEVFDPNVTGEYTGVRLESPDKIGSLNAAIENLPAEQRAKAALCDRMNLPIVKKESFGVAETLITPKQELVWDFAQELTGWVEFDSAMPKGAKLRLTGSEIMQDDCFYHENYRTAKTEFTYISDGEKRHVRPHFTFYCFRYVKAEYWDEKGELQQEIPISGVTAWHLRSDFDQIGFIETGLPKVNKLFSNALWGQKDNFLDVPTDCPQRDERLGWTGDAQVFSETACYNMFMPAFYRKYLWDMRSEQSILDGSVPNVVPRLKEGMVAQHGICPWADAGVIIPWNVWQQYGSKTLLAECYPGMKAWVDCERAKEEAEGGLHLIKSGFHFADWLALDNPNPGPFGATDPLFIASAYYYRCAKAVADSAKVLENQTDAEEYGKLADAIRSAIQETYFDENGLCKCHTQTGSAMAIAFGLIPKNGSVAAEAAALNARVKENNNHLNTGFVGTTILCPSLTEGGYHETAVDLLLNEDYPSWLYSVNLGATTIWERWNSVDADGHISPEGMNSLNHYSYGSIEAWMYRYICGFEPLKPGYRRARINPHADPRLKFVSGRLNTPAGEYASSWKYENGTCIYEITVPFGGEAEVILGDAVRILASGTHRIEG